MGPVVVPRYTFRDCAAMLPGINMTAGDGAATYVFLRDDDASVRT